MSVQAPSRITPLGKITPFRAQRIWEHNYIVYRRLWKIVFSGFFEPVFYLFSIGVGIGSLVGDVTGPGGIQIGYTAFVAPALMAASAGRRRGRAIRPFAATAELARLTRSRRRRGPHSRHCAKAGLA